MGSRWRLYKLRMANKELRKVQVKKGLLKKNENQENFVVESLL